MGILELNGIHFGVNSGDRRGVRGRDHGWGKCEGCRSWENNGRILRWFWWSYGDDLGFSDGFGSSLLTR